MVLIKYFLREGNCEEQGFFRWEGWWEKKKKRVVLGDYRREKMGFLSG